MTSIITTNTGTTYTTTDGQVTITKSDQPETTVSLKDLQEFMRRLSEDK